MSLQDMIDAAGRTARLTRADYHLTLSDAIAALAEIQDSLPVRFDWNNQHPYRAMSYRGYYSDLAFDWRSTETTVREFLDLCQLALGETYEGYKGGDFVMDDRTPLWASEYGEVSGRAIIAIGSIGDAVIIQTKEID